MERQIDKFQVAEILGAKNPNFAFSRATYDDHFPKPSCVGNTQQKTLWWEHEILAFKKTFKIKRRLREEEMKSALNNDMAQAFIRLCGRYWLYKNIDWGELI